MLNLNIRKIFTLPLLLLISAVLLQFLISYSFSVSRYYELKSSAFDGISFLQLLHNIINAKGMTSTIAPPHVEQSWLGVHFSPIIYLLAPVYYLFPDMETLLFIHSFFIALAAFPIFFTARVILNSSWQAFVISLFYLTSPFVLNAQIWDFHEIAFAPFIISLIMFAVVTYNKALFIICCLIMLSIKEHYGLCVFGSGILWAWAWRNNGKKEKIFGISAAIFGLTSFILIIKIIMPYFSPSGEALMLSDSSGVDRFGWLKDPFNNSSLLLKIISDAVFYNILLLVTLWFQPVLSLVWIFPAIADITVNSLSSESMLRHPQAYHSAAIIPVLLITYCKTISKKYSATTKIKRLEILAVTAIMSGFLSYNFMALPNFPRNIWELSKIHFSYSEQNKAARDEIIKIIGDESSVSAQTNILPHIPVRSKMHIFPSDFASAKYIVLNTTTLFNNNFDAFGLPYDRVYMEYGYFRYVDELLESKYWKVVFYKNNWILFSKHTPYNETLQNQAKESFLTQKKHFFELKKQLP